MSGKRSSGRRPKPPASLAAADAQRLDALVEAELERRREDAAEATERAFDHIPRLLRGPARRILGA